MWYYVGHLIFHDLLEEHNSVEEVHGLGNHGKSTKQFMRNIKKIEMAILQAQLNLFGSFLTT